MVVSSFHSFQACASDSSEPDRRLYFLSAKKDPLGPQYEAATAFLWTAKNRRGLITALHAVIDKYVWVATSSTDELISLELLLVAPSSDAAFLVPKVGILPNDTTYPLGPLPKPKDTLVVRGYPDASKPQGEDRYVVRDDWRPGSRLADIPRPGTPEFSIISDLGITDVIWLGNRSLPEGTSGAPVKNLKGEIVGICSGAWGEAVADRSWATLVPDSSSWRDWSNFPSQERETLIAAFSKANGKFRGVRRTEYGFASPTFCWSASIGWSRLYQSDTWSGAGGSFSVEGGLRFRVGNNGTIRAIRLSATIDRRGASGALKTTLGANTGECYRISVRGVQLHAAAVFQALPKTWQSPFVLSAGPYIGTTFSHDINITNASREPVAATDPEWGAAFGLQWFPFGLLSGWSCGPQVRIGTHLASQVDDPRANMLLGSFSEVSFKVGKGLF